MEDGNEEGWRLEYNQIWFDFLAEKGGRGVSKDTWLMVCTPLVLTFKS